LNRILVIRECCLGDLLMATPLLRAIHEGVPGCSIHLATSRWSKPAALGNHRITQIHEYPRIWGRRRGTLTKTLATLRTLRSLQFSAIYCLDIGFQPSLICRLIGAAQRIGFSYRTKWSLLNVRVPREVNDMHETEAYLKLANASGVESSGTQMEFVVPAGATAKATDLIAKRFPESDQFILFFPGGGTNPGTDQLAIRLYDTFGIRSAVTGSPSDKPVCKAVTEFGDGKVINLCPAGPLVDAAALALRAKCVVSNDSAGMHLAAAVGAPLVALFGPTDHRLLAPMGKRVSVVSSITSPTYKQILGTWDRQSAIEAMQSIAVDDVLLAVTNQLKPPSPQGTGKGKSVA